MDKSTLDYKVSIREEVLQPLQAISPRRAFLGYKILLAERVYALFGLCVRRGLDPVKDSLSKRNFRKESCDTVKRRKKKNSKGSRTERDSNPRVQCTLVFKTKTFNHSDICPLGPHGPSSLSPRKGLCPLLSHKAPQLLQAIRPRRASEASKPFFP